MASKEPKFGSIDELVSHMRLQSRIKFAGSNKQHNTIIQLAPKAFEKYIQDYADVVQFIPNTSQPEDVDEMIEFTKASALHFSAMGKTYSEMTVRARYTGFLLLLHTGKTQNEAIVEMELCHREPKTKKLLSEKPNSTAKKLLAIWSTYPRLFIEIALGNKPVAVYDRISSAATRIAAQTNQPESMAKLWLNKMIDKEVKDVETKKDILSTVKIGDDTSVNMAKAYIKAHENNAKLVQSVADFKERNNDKKRQELIQKYTIPGTGTEMHALFELVYIPEHNVSTAELTKLVGFLETQLRNVHALLNSQAQAQAQAHQQAQEMPTKILPIPNAEKELYTLEQVQEMLNKAIA